MSDKWMGFAKGDKVTDGRTSKTYRIVALIDVFGIASADLVLIRKKDGTIGCARRFGNPLKNLPVSCLSKVLS